jgi:hypothetical protein
LYSNWIQLKNINRNQTYCNININAYGGGKIKTLFKTKLKVFCNMSSREIEFIVADVKGQPLLGLAECLKLNLLQKIDSVVKDDNKSKCDFLKEYTHNFNGVGAFTEKYTVKLEQGVQGIIQPPRRLPQSRMTKLKSQLQEMLKAQIISKVEQTKEWASNLVLIEKNDKSLRICIDLRT